MAKKSARQYLEELDFEGAFERFENATKQWKSHWFEVCEQIAHEVTDFLKEYIINPITKTIERKVFEKRQRKVKTDKIFAEVDLLDNAKEKCYLFEFYNEDNELVCSKVGTTTRTVFQRLTEELKSDTYVKTGCVKAIVKRVYDCGDVPSEGLESRFRAEFIRRFPQNFKKNDRFFDTFFDYSLADSIAEEYLGLTN